MRAIRDVEVCRINCAIFVGEADDIPRPGAKPEMCALLRPSTRHRSKYVNTLNYLSTSNLFSYPARSA